MIAPLNIHSRHKDHGSQFRQTVYKAFDFTLKHVGHDIDAGGIWMDYIQFVKEGKVSYLPSYYTDQSIMLTFSDFNSAGVLVKVPEIACDIPACDMHSASECRAGLAGVCEIRTEYGPCGRTNIGFYA